MSYSINQFLFWRTLALISQQSETRTECLKIRVDAFGKLHASIWRVSVKDVEGSSSRRTMAQQIDEGHQESKNKQNMNEVAGEVKSPSEKPEDDQDREDGPKHTNSPISREQSSYSG